MRPQCQIDGLGLKSRGTHASLPMDITTPVFVWRTSEAPRRWGYRECHYCAFPLRRSEGVVAYEDEPEKLVLFDPDAKQREWLEHLSALPEDADGHHHEVFGRALCRRCGWWFKSINTNTGGEATSAGQLREFDINDPSLLVRELCSHLSKRFSDICQLSPRLFEEAVCEVYKQAGWRVTLTAQSRDGGVDLYCLSKNGDERCIVECKRYITNRSVGMLSLIVSLG